MSAPLRSNGAPQAGNGYRNPNDPKAGMIKCSIRGEWKHRDQYSKAKLTEYDKKVRYGGATPNKSSIPCRQHAPGAQISEIQCRGPCLKVQARTQFSKNTLSTGKYWCIDCTQWQLSQDLADHLPAPGTEWSPDEVIVAVTNETPESGNLQDEQIFARRQDAGRDEGSLYGDEAASYTTESRTIGSGQTDSIPPSTAASNPWAQAFDGSSYVPPHLRAAQRSSSAPSSSAGPSTAPTAPQSLAQAPRQGRAPHHYLPPMDDPLTGTLAPTATSSTAGTVRPSVVPQRAQGRPAPAPITFNAWGPNGQHARHVKQPTVASSDAGSRATSTRTARPVSPVKVGKSGWAKPKNGNKIQVPEYLKRGPDTTPAYEYDGESSDEP